MIRVPKDEEEEEAADEPILPTAATKEPVAPDQGLTAVEAPSWLVRISGCG